MIRLLPLWPAAIVVILVLFLIAIFIGGILKQAGLHEPPVIEPQDLVDRPTCAWCQREQAIKALPQESHGICKRHAAEMLEQAKRFSKAA